MGSQNDDTALLTNNINDFDVSAIGGGKLAQGGAKALAKAWRRHERYHQETVLKAGEMTAEAKQIVERAFRILRGKEKFDLDQFTYRSEAALASFKEAVALEPNSYNAWLGLGLSYAFWPSMFDEAFSSFTRAQQINPERPDSFYELGRLLLRHAETNYETAEPQDFERALVFFDKAAKLGYDDPGDLYNLMGTTCFRLKRYREAVECFEQSASTAKPESWYPSTYFLAAEANELEGNLEGALHWYQSYLSKGFRDEDVHRKIRNIKTLIENRRKAL